MIKKGKRRRMVSCAEVVHENMDNNFIASDTMVCDECYMYVPLAG